jgi:hypothetical protein
MVRRPLAVLVLALALALAGSALGAPQRRMPTLFVTGTDVRNDLSISLDSSADEYVIVSTIGFDSPPPPCTSDDADGRVHEIRCPEEAIGRFDVSYGGGPDQVEVDREVSIPVYVHAGSGGDDVSTAGGRDLLQGGPGAGAGPPRAEDDVIRGGPGKDHVRGGPGVDSVRQ